MKCGFYGGDIIKMISEDIPALKPTLFPSVPRLFNRIYGKVMEAPLVNLSDLALSVMY